MSSQCSLGASSSGLASITAEPIALGDTFPGAKAFHDAVERRMMADKKMSRCDKRVSGGRAKLYRCAGAIIANSCRCCGVREEDNKKCKNTSGCQAFVRGCKHADGEWRVTGLLLDHSGCTGQASEKEKRPSRSSLTEEAQKLLHSNPKMSSPAFVKTLKATIGITMVDRTANRLKHDILKGSADRVKEGYQVLDSYLFALTRESKGSIADCEWDDDGRFVRCFMMIGAAARMAAAGMQQVFAMDAAALKGEWNGVFTTLSFKDANNKLIHVATVVSGKENASCYTYLLRKAMENPMLRDVLNNSKTTCFTDKHKGSDAAIPRVCPLTEDRRCVEHLLRGLGVIGPNGRSQIYKAAKAASAAAFQAHMGELKKISTKAYDKLFGTPHAAWANYAGRDNVIWDQTTSNMSESLNNMIGAEARAKPVLGFLQDIVLQTGGRLHCAANLKKDDPNALLTPFATKIFNEEMKWSEQLQVSPCGGGGYMVFLHHLALQAERVTLVYGASPDNHVYDCTCKWCLRWKMPCRHVLAAAKASGTTMKTLELVDKGYSLAAYRAAADDSDYRIVPPVYSALHTSIGHLPPLEVKNPAGRPKRGPRKRTRIPSNGEQNTSSRAFRLHNAQVRRADGAGAAAGSGGGGAGGSAGGSAGGDAAGVMPSSQGVLDLSQGPSQGEYA